MSRKSISTQLRDFFGMTEAEVAESLAKLDPESKAELAKQLGEEGFPVDPRSLNRTPRVKTTA